MNISSKSRPRRRLSRIERTASGMIVAWAALAPGMARAETKAWLDVSADAQIASNPYLAAGTKTSASSAVLNVSPGVQLMEARSTITLSGKFQHTEYSRRYSARDNYTANLNLTRQMSSRLNLNANLGYDSSIVGANEVLTNGPPTDPGGGVQLPPGGISLNGLRERRTALTGGIGLDYMASAHDQFQTQAGFSRVRFPPTSTAREYDSAFSSFDYNRVLNSRTSVGVSVSVSRANYRNSPLGDATTISPGVTFKTKFGAAWSLSAKIGVSSSRITQILGKDTRQSASGSLSVCNKSSLGNFCVFGSRSVQPTSFGGSVAPQTTFGANMQRRLSPSTSISLNAIFSQSDKVTQTGVITAGLVQYGNANVTLTRRFTQRLRGYIGADYADSYKDTPNRKANKGLNIGLAYTFGDTK